MLHNSNVDFPSFKEMLKFEVKNASIYTFSTFILQFGSFLIVPLFWQKLSISDYGIIAIIEILGSFLGMFLGLQLDYSITRFYYEWPEEDRKRRVGTLWVINWISTISLGVVSIYVLSAVSNILFEDVPFYPFIFLGLIYVIVGKLTVVPYATIRIINMPLLYAVYSIVNFAVHMALNIYYVLILDEKLYGLFISNIIGSVITVLMGLLIMARFAVPCIKLDTLKEALRFSLPVIPTSVISGATTFLDRFLLQKFASIEDLGIYNVCLKFTNLVLNFHTALKTSFVPYMVKVVSQDREWGLTMLAKMRLFYLLPLLVTSLAVAIYIKDFVYWINRSEYFPVVEWVPWLIGPTLLSTFTIYYAPGLFLSKRSDLTWIPSIIQLVIVVVSGLLLIPPFKMVGVVVSKYASVFSLFLATFILSEKYYSVPVKWSKLSLMLSLLVLTIVISNLFGFDSIIGSIIFNTLLLVGFSLISIVVTVGYTKVYSSIVFLLKKI